MPSTPHFKWPFPEGSDGVDVPGDIDAAIQAIEDTLTGFDVAELASAGAGDSGKLLIVGAGGVPAWKAMSGNGSINAAGALSIGNAQLATAMLIDQAVTTAKLALLSVTEGQLGEESVAAQKIKTFAVTAVKLAAEAVETAKIKNLAVTAAKIAEEAVTAAKLAASAVTEAKIADGAVTSRKVKPTRGLQVANANTNVLGVSAYTSVLGTERKIVVPTKSVVVVRGVFNFMARDNHANYGSGDFSGIAYIDGVGSGQVGYFRCDTAPDAEIYAAQGNSFTEQEITAGEHTLVLKAHSSVGSEWDEALVQQFGTYMEFEVWAA